MSQSSLKMPLLDRFYFRYLEDRNAAKFLSEVSTTYTIATLGRLASSCNRASRRGALLAITMCGGHSSVPLVGRALSDDDRGVRLISEDGIRDLWKMAGTAEDQRDLQTAVRRNEARDYRGAITILDALVRRNPSYGEAWHQRGIAASGLGEHLEAIDDWQQAVEFEPYHFLATMRMADAFLRISDLNNSATCLQWTLRIYPRCEVARARLQRIERLLGEQTDC